MSFSIAPSPVRTQTRNYSSEKEKWNAVLEGDSNADGQFYYAVKTTGIYCLPSCSARRAHRANVSFHGSPEEAEQAGFRPCKRCWPKGPELARAHRDAVSKACRVIEMTTIPPTLGELARVAGMSPFHFHRIFKSLTGLTPKGYATARRTQNLRAALARRGTVTAAIHEAGFNSTGHFYEKSSACLGMSATKFRDGGQGTLIRYAIAKCSLGAALIAASEIGVCAITFGQERGSMIADLRRRFPKAELIGGDSAFEGMVARVIAAIESPGNGFDLPLDIRGTAFQQRVWQALREIPAGTTVSYAEIAKRVGAPKAIRAVAGACAANSIAVVIPCHRVVRGDGHISGYRWGVERKRALLRKEAKA